MVHKLRFSPNLLLAVCILSVVVFFLSAVSTMEFWFATKAVMDVTSHLLLFALLLACAVKWQRSLVAASLPVIWVAFVLVGHAPFFQSLTVQHAYPGLLPLTLVSFAANAIGFTLIAKFGCRRLGEQELRAATSWPRLRLLLAFTFALLLNVAMTVPNLA